MNENWTFTLPNLDMEELAYIRERTDDLSEQDLNQFILIYRGKRRDPQLILITTILGFVVVAGIQRFLVGQIGMGILYLLTAGLCFIGTIVDLVNYKSLATEYNKKMIDEARQIFDATRR